MLGAAVGAGVLAVRSPILALAACALVALAGLLMLGDRLAAMFLGFHAIVVVGYVFLGKGFAYVGAAPLYIGELSLGIAIVALFVALPRIKFGWVQLVILAFMLVGLARTVPFIRVYGIDAVRDAALWYYAAFAISLSILIQRRHIEALVKWCVVIAPILVFWLAAMTIFGRLIVSMIPKYPGAPVPLYYVKAGDKGVILAGVAVLLLVGFEPRSVKWLPQPVIWGVWLATAAYAAVNRGAMLSILTSIVAVFLLRPSRGLLRLVMYVLFFGLIIAAFNPTVDLGSQRNVSVSQLQANLVSIFSSDNSESGLSHTKDWRLKWWKKIIGYTIKGPLFMTGKGFGVNLADVDGFQVTSDHSLRSPHNSHMTILARMGVPGMTLWIILQLSFAVEMLGIFIRARRLGMRFWASLDIWILAVWLAMMVDTSFDVYLEGPQGGILFWSIFGLGLAAHRIQKDEFSGKTRLSASMNDRKERHARPAYS